MCSGLRDKERRLPGRGLIPGRLRDNAGKVGRELIGKAGYAQLRHVT